MEYSSFVRELRKKTHSPYTTNPSDTQYAREFEEQMQALVINFDIEDTPEVVQQHSQHYSLTSTPQTYGSGSKCKTRKTPISTGRCDETERLAEEVPKKKIAVNFDQGPESSQGSFESSEGISMRYDSSSSSEDIPHLVSWNEYACDTTNPMPTGREKHISPVPFETLHGEEDSLLEPANYSSSPKAAMPAAATTKLPTVPAKRTYDEANR
uniref:Uncharacterized protein n=1 Tax=Anopheles christyi TaxID=43041 RepID=A0A182JV91_9DIPT